MRLKRVAVVLALVAVLAGCTPPPRVPAESRRPPRRLLALAPGSFEQLCALGLRGRVVGTTDFSDWPPGAAAGLPSVGSYVSPSLEAVLALRPDLALAAFGTRRAVLERLRACGLEVRMSDPHTVEAAVGSLSEVARWCGAPTAGQEVERGLSARLSAVRRALSGAARPRVFLQLGCGSLFSAARGSLQGDLIREAGGENVAAGLRGPYPLLSLEQVLALAPEVILIITDDKADFEREKEQWLALPLPAARAHRVFRLPMDPVQRPGPRLIGGLELTAALLHPERFPQPERLAGRAGGRQ